jgi:ArsR family transcriptional regulator
VDGKLKERFARLEVRASVLKAIAHPTRLFILDELSNGKKSVLELTDMIGADISTVSKHLAVLKGAGIVRDEKEGLKVYYSIAIPCALDFFGCVDRVIKIAAEERLNLISGGRK